MVRDTAREHRGAKHPANEWMSPKLVRRKRFGFGLAARDPGSQKASEGAGKPDIPDDPVRMALLRDLKERRRKLDLEAKREAEKEARKKAALRREILTVRQKLNREARRKGCTVERKKEIAHELDDLLGLEHQECGRHPRKHPSTRPSASELRFKTDAPSVDEILESGNFPAMCFADDQKDGRPRKPASNTVG